MFKQRNQHTYWRVAILCLLMAGLAVFCFRPATRNTSEALRVAARAAARGEFQTTLKSADAVLVTAPHSAQALLLAGHAAAQLQRPDLALRYFRRVEPDGSGEAVEASVLAGDVELARGDASAAEEWYRSALRQDPQKLQAQRQLAYLLGVEGRCWEAAPFLLAAVRQGQFTLHHLVLLAAAEPVIKDAELVERCRAAVPDDPVPLIGLARTALKLNQVSSALGEFFQNEYLGRGLARLDWNRDGLEDFAVSNMNAPASLVLNQTSTAGHFLAIELRGIGCDRDAIGTIVRVTVGQHTYTSQLTAGDGYEVSNQRRLVFGLEAAQSVDQVEIRWPHGRVQELGKTAMDRELLIREGTDATSIPLE